MWHGLSVITRGQKKLITFCMGKQMGYQPLSKIDPPIRVGETFIYEDEHDRLYVAELDDKNKLWVRCGRSRQEVATSRLYKWKRLSLDLDKFM